MWGWETYRFEWSAVVVSVKVLTCFKQKPFTNYCVIAFAEAVKALTESWSSIAANSAGMGKKHFCQAWSHVGVTPAWVNSRRGILGSLVGSEQFFMGEEQILFLNKLNEWVGPHE